jgi:hypothetical protein
MLSSADSLPKAWAISTAIRPWKWPRCGKRSRATVRKPPRCASIEWRSARGGKRLGADDWCGERQGMAQAGRQAWGGDGVNTHAVMDLPNRSTTGQVPMHVSDVCGRERRRGARRLSHTLFRAYRDCGARKMFLLSALLASSPVADGNSEAAIRRGFPCAKLCCFEYVDFSLEALPQAEVACSHGMPAVRLLVEVEAAADLDNPAVVYADLPIMQRLLQFDL